MNKLTKLNAKKIESLETIKGGLYQLTSELADSEACGTTIHSPTHYSGPDVYLCDHKRDN
ncbi:hypothetical protein [Chitinophaga varians]|uniref:hypothetical protein n=1 Tax=Chitinophaga varians TaxID=2202339 RepID=UPI001CB6CE10|nr:hypothetical protein [Chitinophaga varians]